MLQFCVDRGSMNFSFQSEGSLCGVGGLGSSMFPLLAWRRDRDHRIRVNSELCRPVWHGECSGHDNLSETQKRLNHRLARTERASFLLSIPQRTKKAAEPPKAYKCLYVMKFFFSSMFLFILEKVSSSLSVLSFIVLHNFSLVAERLEKERCG